MYQLVLKAKDPVELRNALKDAYEKEFGIRKENLKAVVPEKQVAGPSPVQAPVFTPPAAPTVASSGPVELDARGIPWNEQVHASSKAKTKEGNWRAKREVDKSLLKQIESQSQRPVAQTFTPPQPEAPKVQPLFPGQYANATQPAPQYPPMPSSFHGQPVIPQQPSPVAPVSSPQPAQVTPAPQEFDNFSMARRQAHDAKSWLETFNESIGKLVADGKINVDYLNQIKTHYNVQELWHLNDNQKVEIFHQLAGYGLVHNVAGNV